jgi:PAS domain S-box-containing protein
MDRGIPASIDPVNESRQARIFDTTLSSITDFAYIFDKSGRFAYANQALLNLWGLKLEDAVGKDFFDLHYPPDLALKLQQQIQKVFTTREVIRDETPYTSPTGVVGYYEYIFSPVIDEAGNVEVVAGSTRDITQRKRTEQALRESDERYRMLAGALETQVAFRTQELRRRNEEILEQSEQIRELSRQLLQTQDEERRHIARDLHDSAGQTLVVLTLQLAQLVKEAKDTAPRLAENAEGAAETAQQLLREIRTASYLLHPPLLEESGLAAAVEWYVRGLAERSGIDITFEIAAGFERCDPDLELIIFRLVQESLTNVHRHSKSKSAQVRIARQDGNIVLEVQDRGRGMSPDRLAEVQSRGFGVGVRGMRERARQFQGEFSIESNSSGTKISVTIPALKTSSLRTPSLRR